MLSPGGSVNKIIAVLRHESLRSELKSNADLERLTGLELGPYGYSLPTAEASPKRS